MQKKLPSKLLCLIIFIGLCLLNRLGPLEAASSGGLEPIKKSERILILAPHPDDEAIGCAGVIQQALTAGAKVEVAYLTNGDHNQVAFIVYEKRLTFKKAEFIHMGEVRRLEAIKAMKLLGLDENSLIFLGYPDFGTFTIFSQYWQSNKPYRSFLTRVSSVPYKNDFSFGAPYKGENILNDLEKVIVSFKPHRIFVSHPADVNVDHKALYLFLQVALADLKDKIPKPKVYPYLVHCVGWPKPRRYHPDLDLEPPSQFQTQIYWQEFQLTPQQLDKKYKAILCYKSQTESSAFYLLAFARKNELFGDYSTIELSKQVSLKESAVSFFGFSNMFADSDMDMLGNFDKLLEIKGRVSYAVVDNHLLIRIDKAGKFNNKFGMMLYLFGYSYKTPFEAMPKLRIITKGNRLKVFDQRHKIMPEGISMKRTMDELIMRIPLSLLGNPDFILTSLKAYWGILPVDVAAFRKIEIKDQVVK